MGRRFESDILSWGRLGWEPDQIKITGAGKKTRHREICISVYAYVAVSDWLEVGWRLWASAPSPRQNFTALPDLTFEQFRDVGAEVQDRVALARNLLERLKLSTGDNDEKGLNNKAARFWTEHSSRPSLPSWARALGVPTEVTDRLGYWAVGAESAEVYIRTCRGLISQVQNTVASYMREAYFPKHNVWQFPGIVGELEVIDEFRTDLKDKSDESSSERGRPEPNFQTHVLGARESSRRRLCGSSVGPSLKEGNAIEDNKMEKLAESTSGSEENATLSLPPYTAAWIITKPAKTKLAGCLHVIGRCHRVPGSTTKRGPK